MSAEIQEIKYKQITINVVCVYPFIIACSVFKSGVDSCESIDPSVHEICCRSRVRGSPDCDPTLRRVTVVQLFVLKSLYIRITHTRLRP